MRNKIILLIFLMVFVSSQLSSQESHVKNIMDYNTIFPLKERASSDYNTGDVFVSLLKEEGETMIAHFLFEPNSRNFWHYHPDAVQTLLVLDGEGYYQEEGKPIQIIRKGDVIITPANARHWNGATPNSKIVCMTVTEHAIESHAVQLRAVTDEEYLGYQ